MPMVRGGVMSFPNFSCLMRELRTVGSKFRGQTDGFDSGEYFCWQGCSEKKSRTGVCCQNSEAHISHSCSDKSYFPKLQTRNNCTFVINRPQLSGSMQAMIMLIGTGYRNLHYWKITNLYCCLKNNSFPVVCISGSLNWKKWRATKRCSGSLNVPVLHHWNACSGKHAESANCRPLRVIFMIVWQATLMVFFLMCLIKNVQVLCLAPNPVLLLSVKWKHR